MTCWCVGLLLAGLWASTGTAWAQDGACCDLGTGQCGVTSQQQCVGGGRVFIGGSCQPSPCPTGACCQPGGSLCTVTGPTGCVGGYRGDGTTCSPNPCPGACCSADSQCTPTTQAQCQGTWTPGVCTPSLCPGACCNLTTGGCFISPPSACSSGSIFVGGVCGPTRCPSGACCDTLINSCRITGPLGCATGTYQGDQVGCEPNPCPGACCGSNSACTMTTQAACQGTWSMGACTPASCPGACCNLSTGSCTIAVQPACTVGSIFLGGACEPDRCPTGACCDVSINICRITGPTGCQVGLYRGDRSVCEPNPCPGACCAADSSCTMTTQAQCQGVWAPGACNPASCPGACCNLGSGACTIATRPVCSLGSIFFGGVCLPNPCPMGACCDSFGGFCRITGPQGCGLDVYRGDGSTCQPNACPAACCDPVTGACTVRPQSECTGRVLPQTACSPNLCPPVARCRNLVFDASSDCIRPTATAQQFDDGSFAAVPNCAVSVSIDNPGPYPVGQTLVTLTVTDCNNRTSTCEATVTVLGVDCNHNGISDVCECLWEAGGIATNGSAVNGQASHLGGGSGPGMKVADDFYVAPGAMYRVFSFTGVMATDVLPALRKARVELYEDCDGSPAGSPLYTFDTARWTELRGPDATGTVLVRYTFELCDEHLWLEGGKTYWWSLFGLGSCDGADLSSWVAATNGRVAGRPAVKSDGLGGQVGGSCYPTLFGPWQGLDECCIGCVDMTYRVYGAACPIIWDNGAAVVGSGAGGVLSENISSSTRSRAADDFVVKPCVDQTVCLIDAWVWSNCNPVRGFVEIYEDDCGRPGALYSTLSEPEVIATGEVAVIDGVSRRGYILRFDELMLGLPGGHSYWLSAGGDRTGSFNARTYFAYGERCQGCGRHGRESQRRAAGQATWTPVGPDLAFRVASMPLETRMMVVDGPPATGPVCKVDLTGDGEVTVQDLFEFLAGFFAGCP